LDKRKGDDATMLGSKTNQLFSENVIEEKEENVKVNDRKGVSAYDDIEKQEISTRRSTRLWMLAPQSRSGKRA